MKIYKEIWSLGVLMEVQQFRDIPSAVEDATQSSTELAELVSRLVDTAFGEAAFRYTNIEKLSYVLGSGYQVEE